MSFIKAFNNLVIKRNLTVRALHPKKFVSILEEVPVKPRNPWQIYLREKMSQQKQQGEKIDLKTATKTYSAQWKSLSDSEKEKYKATYSKELELHNKKFKEAMDKATPKQFHEENKLRKKYKLELLKDPKQPKRPMNNFLFFLEHLRTTHDPIMQEANVRQQLSDAAKKFKTLDQNELKVYNDKARAANEQFTRDMNAYKASAI